MISFPLHMLPNNAAKLVLMHMEPEEKFSYSLCSKTTINNVRALNLTAEKIKFDVEKDILVTVQIDFETELVISLSPNSNLASFPRDQDFKICVWLSATKTGIWYLPKYSNQKVFHHLLEIFHHPRLDDLVFYNDAFPFDDNEPISKIVYEVKVGLLKLGWSLTGQSITRTLERFKNYDELYVDSFHGLEADKILMQNLRRMINFNSYNMMIDQVLISNLKMIQFHFTMFAEKDFNRFLKLWIRGSNPRLKQFHAGGPTPYRPLDAELILEGIKYKRIPLSSNAVHRRKMIGGWEDETRLAGGYIIRRYNGDDAVVVIENDTLKFITDCF